MCLGKKGDRSVCSVGLLSRPMAKFRHQVGEKETNNDTSHYHHTKPSTGSLLGKHYMTTISISLS